MAAIPIHIECWRHFHIVRWVGLPPAIVGDAVLWRLGTLDDEITVIDGAVSLPPPPHPLPPLRHLPAERGSF